jgi:LPS-assembly lipoprotein
MNRRSILVAGLAPVLVMGSSLLVSCGFRLRSSQTFAFETLAITPEGGGGGIGVELARNLGSKLVPLAPALGAAQPQVIVDLLQESRVKTVVGTNATGQVREFQLKLSVKFRMRTPTGVELIAPTEITQQRDISFNESAVLAKEAEEQLLYREMQTDIVQQLLRRLAAIQHLDGR